MKKVCSLQNRGKVVKEETYSEWLKQNKKSLKKQYAEYKKLPGADLTFNKYTKELFEYDKHAGGGKVKIPKLFVGGGQNELDNPYWDKDTTEVEVEEVEQQPSIEERAQDLLDKLKESGKTLRLVRYKGHRVVETIKVNADKKTYSQYYSAPGSTASAVLQNGNLDERDIFNLYIESLNEGFAKGGRVVKIKEFKEDAGGNYTHENGYSLINQFDGTYQVLDADGEDISGEYETLEQAIQTINDYHLSNFAGGGKVYTDNRDGYNAKYWVGKNKSGQWTVFSESDKWKKRDEYEGGLASEKDAIYMAKLSAGVITEADPEEAFMNKFATGGIMDSRIALLKKMDAKNPSTTLKARIKLLEKMGKKAEPKAEPKQKVEPKPKVEKSNDWSGTDWENEVYEALEEIGEMDRSDAQGVAEASEKIEGTITKSYKDDLSAEETAKAILKATEVPEEPKKPEPKKATNWKSLFADPGRFQKYGGEFLYPPRAENKVRPNAMMFGKLDNNTFIAEPKMNGSATSVTIFENTVVVKERHNTFFSVPPTFDFAALHRGKGAMCIVGEFMNKSKKDEEGKAFKGFCIWDITAYEDQILIGSTIEERLKLLDQLYPTKSVIKTKAGTELLYTTEVPDIYKVAVYDKDFEKLFNELTKIDAIEGFVLKRKNAKLEMMTSETNNQGSFIKLRKSTKNYEF